MFLKRIEESLQRAFTFRGEPLPAKQSREQDCISLSELPLAKWGDPLMESPHQSMCNNIAKSKFNTIAKLYKFYFFPVSYTGNEYKLFYFVDNASS